MSFVDPLNRDTDIQKIIQNVPNEADQLDQIAKVHGSYDPYDDADVIISQYMAGDLAVDEAVVRLAEPVEHCYTTMDEGRALYEEERVARSQRGYHEPSEAAEMWGVEQDFPEPTEDDRWKPSVEGMLWGLWFAVCHMSRKTAWDDEKGQDRLVHLVRAIKPRPDPPAPEAITIPVKRNWVWSSGKVWSNLLLFGPSARETWNNCPGGGWGFTIPEVHAWTNTNAFFARITAAGVKGYWNCGIWALRDTLEDEPKGDQKGSEQQYLDATLPAVAMWIYFAGEEAYRYICENDPDPEKRYNVNEPFPSLGWQEPEVWTMARWVFWREKFGVMAERKDLAEETRDFAADAARFMGEIEAIQLTKAS